MESWFLVPRIERTLIKKSINKLYTNHNIARRNYKPVVVTLTKDGVDDKIPIKKIRSKSVVLSKPLRNGDCVQIVYEYWVGCESNGVDEFLQKYV
jgi:uncharacterized protein YllA (UPF0747 family)